MRSTVSTALKNHPRQAANTVTFRFFMAVPIGFACGRIKGSFKPNARLRGDQRLSDFDEPPQNNFRRSSDDTPVVRVPGVEPGSIASEATTLSIVLHSRKTWAKLSPVAQEFKLVLSKDSFKGASRLPAPRAYFFSACMWRWTKNQ